MPARQYNNFSTLETDPLRNFKFLVHIRHNPEYAAGGHLGTLGFTSVSGLTMTTEAIPYRQGGYNTTVHQIPGQTTFAPITLQRGVMIGTAQSFNWMRQLFTTIIGTGNFPNPRARGGVGSFRARVDIDVLDHPVTYDRDAGNNVDNAAELGSSGTGYLNVPVKMRFRIYNAWISALSYSDLNAGDNSLLVEQMTLVHEGWDMKMAPTGTGAEAPGFAV